MSIIFILLLFITLYLPITRHKKDLRLTSIYNYLPSITIQHNNSLLISAIDFFYYFKHFYLRYEKST